MQVQGLDAVVVDFAKASATIHKRAAGIVKEHTDRTVDTAKQLVPQDRPELVNRIKSDVKGTRGEAVAEGSSRPRVIPAFVEYGTHKDRPQPFMGPAHDRHAPDFVKDMEALGGDV
jgi:HK97 gp10 family phage protein